MTTLQDMLDKAGQSVSVRDVFGEPYERDGVTVIPVARVSGGGGGGSATGESGGHGWGMKAEPAGAYVIKGGDVRWVTAVNVNRIVTGSFAVGIAWAIVAPRIAKHTWKWRR